MSELREIVKNQKVTQMVIQECISKISSIKIKALWQLNKAYQEAMHDLKLLERVGAITSKDMNEAKNKMVYLYVEKGLNIGKNDEEEIDAIDVDNDDWQCD